MLNCGDNALWAVSLPYSPPHKSLLGPTEQLKGAFIGPEHLLPRVQGPVIVLANLNRAFTVCGRKRDFFAASLAVLLPAVVLWTVRAARLTPCRFIVARKSVEVNRRSAKLARTSRRSSRTVVAFGRPLLVLSATESVARCLCTMEKTVL